MKSLRAIKGVILRRNQNQLEVEELNIQNVATWTKFGRPKYGDEVDRMNSDRIQLQKDREEQRSLLVLG